MAVVIGCRRLSLLLALFEEAPGVIGNGIGTRVRLRHLPKRVPICGVLTLWGPKGMGAAAGSETEKGLQPTFVAVEEWMVDLNSQHS